MEGDGGLRASIVIPVYNEGEGIVPVVQRIVDIVQIPIEILCVYDSEDDSTVPFRAACQRILNFDPLGFRES